jgi:hypothetical protein
VGQSFGNKTNLLRSSHDGQQGVRIGFLVGLHSIDGIVDTAGPDGVGAGNDKETFVPTGSRGLGNVNHSVLVRGVAPAACPVEDEGAITYTDDLETRLGHLRERNARFKNGLFIAHRPATEIERFKTHLRCKLGHQGG